MTETDQLNVAKNIKARANISRKQNVIFYFQAPAVWKQNAGHFSESPGTCIYIGIYIYMCVCVCVELRICWDC